MLLGVGGSIWRFYSLSAGRVHMADACHKPDKLLIVTRKLIVMRAARFGNFASPHETKGLRE